MLLAAIVAAPVSSVALFAPAARPRRTSGRLAAARRLVLALAGTAVLAGAAAGALWLFGFGTAQVVAGGLGLAVMSLAWLPATVAHCSATAGRP